MRQAEKYVRKREKRERLERLDAEGGKVRRLLTLQGLLDAMGAPSARDDFISGANGAVVGTDRPLPSGAVVGTDSPLLSGAVVGTSPSQQGRGGYISFPAGLWWVHPCRPSSHASESQSCHPEK